MRKVTIQDRGLTTADIVARLREQPVTKDADGKPVRQIVVKREIWNSKTNRKRARDKFRELKCIDRYIDVDYEEVGDVCGDEKMNYIGTLTERIVTAVQRKRDDAKAEADRKAAADAEAQAEADAKARAEREAAAEQERIDRIEQECEGALGVAEAAVRTGNPVEVVLTSDAYGKGDKFAILGGLHDEPLWYGLFFENGMEQSAAEMDAAKKAVWLAAKIGEWLTEKFGRAVQIKLTLRTDAQWLTFANGDGRNSDGSRYGGNARALSAAADRAGIQLQVVHIPGDENPADRYTRQRGYMKHQDGDLREALTL